MDLPSGLNVYDVISAALQNPEYRYTIIKVIGYIWWSGFFVGALVYILVNGRRRK
jgi:hypothetical protein